jgi:hypothetical protein
MQPHLVLLIGATCGAVLTQAVLCSGEVYGSKASGDNVYCCTAVIVLQCPLGH